MSTATLPERPATQPVPLPPLPAGAPQWVMIARTGSWLGHPAVPEVIGPEHLHSALDYFARHYAPHGADVVVDYHHASVGAARAGLRAPAAGWVQEMELRNDGTELWGRVMWTAEAAAAIAGRRYRYLSPVLRFNAPDRVTGEPVPMVVHSVALTNTPFLTELAGLNEARGDERTQGPPAGRPAGRGAATDGGAGSPIPTEGGESMSLLESLASALGQEPEQVASRLGLEASAGDGRVAQALGGRRLPDCVCNALGVEPDCDEPALKVALIRLKAPGAGMAAVRARLALPEDADESVVLNAIEALQAAVCTNEAEALVDEAVRAGRVPPAHREFYLREAVNDVEAARAVIESLPTLLTPPAARPAHAGRGLTADEESVCRQLGLAPAAFVAAAAG